MRAILGVVILVAIAWALSSDRKKINWVTVGGAFGLQLILAVLILKVPFVNTGFDWLAKAFVKVISFTDDGSDFLFRSFFTGETAPELFNFAFRILPTIVFFSALSALMYYWGILQKIVWLFAWVMQKTLRLSGAESLAAAGNVFLGQTEAPLLVKPFLDRMTKSEMMCLMTGGMATIAGGVLASYVGFLGGDNDAEKILFAKHLLAASIMSAPAAIAAAKILVPEREEVDTKLKIHKAKIGSNALEAIANGTSDGIKLAVNVGAMLLVFTALIYFGNYLMFKGGAITGLNEWIATNTPYEKFSFEFVLGYVGAPIAWLMGVCSEDALLVGQLLGEKTILNEFYAYKTLGDMKSGGQFVEGKSVIIATYVLCGFANFASIGIQIGGIGALVPNRKGLLSKLGVKALIGGTLACLFTAAIAGLLI
ncbi:MAG: CNT family concentrative nucleoside transporter [Flavobacteriales bacterium]|jgi:CNT family concentrative nucleoside transporter